MQRELNAVRDFHQALDISHECEFNPEPIMSEALHLDLEKSKRLALRLQDLIKSGDARYLRMHLIIEEATEFCRACQAGDEVMAFDALIDLLYVTLGTAVQFQWPLQEGFDEVHASNMTKQKQSSDPHSARVRDKGSNYRPPNLEPILASYRKVREENA